MWNKKSVRAVKKPSSSSLYLKAIIAQQCVVADSILNYVRWLGWKEASNTFCGTGFNSVLVSGLQGMAVCYNRQASPLTGTGAVSHYTNSETSLHHSLAIPLSGPLGQYLHGVVPSGLWRPLFCSPAFLYTCAWLSPVTVALQSTGAWRITVQNTAAPKLLSPSTLVFSSFSRGKSW